MQFGDYNIKNYKGTRGMEGPGFTGNLYRGSIKVGPIADWGDGGPAYLQRGSELNREEEDMLAQYVKNLPPEPWSFGDGSPLVVSVDFFLGSLGEHTFNEKKLRNKCKKNTCFITSDCSEGEYFVLSLKFTPEVASSLRANHGGKLKEIINERY